MNDVVPPRSQDDYALRFSNMRIFLLCYDENMIAPEIQTTTEGLKLITPNVERDAPLGVDWLREDIGRKNPKTYGRN